MSGRLSITLTPDIEIDAPELMDQPTVVLMLPYLAEPGAPGGSSDHGTLAGLADDDHAQYHTDARGDARYSALGHGHTPASLGAAAAAHGHAQADVTGLVAALGLLAPLASPALSGTPIAPTAAPGTNTAQIATMAAVQAAIAALINTAPGALDTLDELAAAMGDDANFAASVSTALAGKQPLAATLTALAALGTTAYGRALLELADAAAGRSALGAAAAYMATVDFGAEGESQAVFDVAVAGAAVGQKVVASASLDMPAGVAEDELEMDMLAVAGRVTGTNNVRLIVASLGGRISGQRNINLILG